jgi:hypothetical protein
MENNKIAPEVMLHLTMVYALNLMDEIGLENNLKKAARSVETFTRKSSENMEKTEKGSDYQALCVHNFNLIMDMARDKGILLAPLDQPPVSLVDTESE